ncbi:hypothetical protein EDD86DRAFT_267004 [Gorgonomyces haynaldii]|nr:hypothetical protein EDD86DRAFT_267004 [Gorgonomyces haynaldii]
MSTLQPYAFSRGGGYKQPGMVFHGIGLFELCACITLLLRKYNTDPHVTKTTIFRLAILAVCGCTVTLVMYIMCLEFLVRDVPIGNPSWAYYYSVTIPVSSISPLPSIFTHGMMLVRLRAFGGFRTKIFITMAFFTLIHVLLTAYSGYLSYVIQSSVAEFWTAPGYKLWISLAGITILIDAFLSLASAYYFLSHICASLDLNTWRIVREVAVHHEGPRWVALILVNINIIFTVLGINTTLVAICYHITPFQYLLSIYCFLESSYFAAKDIMTTHSKAAKKLVVSTLHTKSVSESVNNASSSHLK